MENSSLAGKKISDLRLNNIDITILAIERGNKLFKTVRGNDTLEIGDKLILYGNINSVKNVFDSFRPYQ
jgi:Trk K+ transport system NAD-binding subunit